MTLIGGMPVRLDLLKLFVCWKMPIFAEGAMLGQISAHTPLIIYKSYDLSIHFLIKP